MPSHGFSKAWVLVALGATALVLGTLAKGWIRIGVGPATVNVGAEEAVIGMPGAGTRFPLFPDEQTLLDLSVAEARRDQAAVDAILDRAAASGAFVVGPGTRVKILERRSSTVQGGGTVRVQILEGEASGKTGWAFAKMVQSASGK